MAFLFWDWLYVSAIPPMGFGWHTVTIDWTEREAVRAKIRVAVKRILRKHGYPPDKQAKATQTVLQQAKLLCADWAT